MAKREARKGGNILTFTGLSSIKAGVYILFKSIFSAEPPFDL